ncbi:MAG: hypothetical protein ACJ8AD_16015, partial [Gemmatimonadaceae bacterium]
LFVAPFLVHLVVTRRWRMTAWTAAVYAAGSLYWLHWLAGVQPQAKSAGMGGLFALFQLPGLFSFLVQGMSLTLLTTWQTPVVALGLTAALLRVRALAHPLRELMFGVLLSFGFYLLFPSAQGHGWGYRYIFPVLGGMALLATDGWSRIATELRPRAARMLLVGGLALVLVQLPVRAAEVEATVRPFAAASEYVHSRPADVVVLPVWSWWYGVDLVRNDPWFADGPVVLAAPNVTEKQFNDMVTRLGGKAVRVWTVPYAGLARFGMQPPFPAFTPPSAEP